MPIALHCCCWLQCVCGDGSNSEKDFHDDGDGEEDFHDDGDDEEDFHDDDDGEEIFMTMVMMKRFS